MRSAPTALLLLLLAACGRSGAGESANALAPTAEAADDLVITGRKSDSRSQNGNYLHVGIATRAFERRFELADFVRPEGAEMKDGLLSIELVREIPEAMKPRKIDIRAGSAQEIEGDGATERRPEPQHEPEVQRETA